MTRPRKDLISLSDTPYYHVTSRCVRRAFLCGVDQQTQRSYEHRKQWIEDRIRLLSSLFAIDICAYAVMSNHYHIVVKINPETALEWSQQEVITRWTCLYKGPLLIQQQQQGLTLSPAQQQSVSDIVATWREHLTSLSWFMKCLNEPIARQANKEDHCRGHFWEARFKSQALLTETALLSCMAYVDLNPVRASVADTPENSDHTSIKERIHPTFNLNEAIQQSFQSLHHADISLKPLLHFNGGTTSKRQNGIPFSQQDYLELVDWTGRIVRKDKPGLITKQLPPILERLNTSPQRWMRNSTQFEKQHQQHFQRRRVMLL